MYNTLTDLMTGICDAIREKEGSSELIPVQDIPERINGIKSGGENLLKTSISNFIPGIFDTSFLTTEVTVVKEVTE